MKNGHTSYRPFNRGLAWSCLLVEYRALSFLGCVIFGFSRVVKAVKERLERNGMMG